MSGVTIRAVCVGERDKRQREAERKVVRQGEKRRKGERGKKGRREEKEGEKRERERRQLGNGGERI